MTDYFNRYEVIILRSFMNKKTLSFSQLADAAKLISKQYTPLFDEKCFLNALCDLQNKKMVKVKDVYIKCLLDLSNKHFYIYKFDFWKLRSNPKKKHIKYKP